MSKDKNTITKLIACFSMEKEMERINKMNKEGWKLVYVKGGVLFTFVKAKPDEYVTVLHADKKENISRVAAFAAQCGYESVPHTMDGFGDFLYLTGKKSEVSENFVSDSENLMTFYEIARKKYNTFSIIYLISCGVFALLTALYAGLTYFCDFDPFLLSATSVIGVVFIITVALTIKLFTLKHKCSKKIKVLKKDSAIFE